MLKVNRTKLLLLLIFTFSFIYRMVLMLRDTFPPGADIGLHNSVIYSITGSGNVNFFYNFYHIGGGTSLTFPGYHIFTASVIAVTGLPEYVAHAAVVSLFSALIVLAGYLITKRIWSEPAALIVAFLVAISRFDIEMLLWGGYPNVITLLLIPLTFYLYLQKDRFSNVPFLASTSILAGSIFLTHSLSAAVFVAITAVTTLFSLVKPKMFGTTRKACLWWILPIAVGAILFSPFIIQAVPAYLNNNSSLSGDSASAEAIKLATLTTRPLPLELVLPLFGAFVGLLVFSKKQFGCFLSLPTFLLAIWLFIPWSLTLSYLVGFPIDYNRFLYFLILPLIIFIAVFIEHGSSFFAQIITHQHTIPRQLKKIDKITNQALAHLSAVLTHKTVYAAFIAFFLIFSFGVLPIFMGPIYNGGQTIQEFYQTMNQPGWEAIQWAKTNTPKDAVFLSDALYGWWLGGFAQRPTYSAVEPQYLSISEEYPKTLFARTLLDTDYLVDNGLIQVREDGGYITRHNPEIVAKLTWAYNPVTFFTFVSNETTLDYSLNGVAQPSVHLDELSLTKMEMERNNEQVTIMVSRSNDYFNYTQLTTVYRGLRFVNLTTTIDSSIPDVSLDKLYVDVQSKGNQISFNDNRTIGTIGMFDESIKVLGQLIFTKNQPLASIVNTTVATNTGNFNQTRVHLEYNSKQKQSAEIQISASAYSVSDDPSHYVNADTKNGFLSSLIAPNLDPNQTPDYSKEWEQVFDYRYEIQRYNVSYIACRTSPTQGVTAEMYPKFFKDPSFSLVFFSNASNTEVINEIAIFKVNGNLK